MNSHGSINLLLSGLSPPSSFLSSILLSRASALFAIFASLLLAMHVITPLYDNTFGLILGLLSNSRSNISDLRIESLLPLFAQAVRSVKLTKQGVNKPLKLMAGGVNRLTIDNKVVRLCIDPIIFSIPAI